MAPKWVGKRCVGWFIRVSCRGNASESVECVAFAALVGAGERMKALFCYIRREKHVSSWRNVPTKHLNRLPFAWTRVGDACRWPFTYHATIVFWHRQIYLLIYKKIQNIISISRKNIVSSQLHFSSYQHRPWAKRTPYWRPIDLIKYSRERNEHLIEDL